MPSFESLWRTVFPRARLQSGTSAAALERPVAWVRVLKARVPAFDAMDPDDLAILPGTTLGSLAALAVEPAAVIEAVARARGGGVLVVADDDAADSVTSDALRRAAALGLATFQVPETDISALERSAIAYIVNGQAELERRAASLEVELEQVALAGGGAEGLAATIARFLGRSVAIEDRRGTVLAVHAPPGAPDAAVTGQYLRRRRGAALRVPLPPVVADSSTTGAPRGDGNSGALVLLGSGAASELERAATARVAALVALEIGRGQAGGVRDRASDDLPSAGPPWAALVARQIDAAEPSTRHERQRLRDELRAMAPERRLGLRGDAESVELRMVAALTDDDPRGVGLAARVASRIGRPVAVSRPFADRADRPVMESQARATLEAIEGLPAAERRQLALGDGAVVAVDELTPAYRLIGALTALPDARRQAEALLGPLLSGRPHRDADSLATLRAVLDHPGLSEAAAALGVHRNTLAYRLQGIERRTGWSLSEPILRMALAVAIRIVQNDQERAASITTAERRTGLAAG